jgi:hypothetical protein
MKLTRMQKTVLQIYWRYHTGGWRLGPVLRVNWWRWLLLAVVAAGGSWFAFRISSWVGGLVIGLCAGAFFRDVGQLRNSFRWWPVAEEIINWQRVEELVQSHEPTTAEPRVKRPAFLLIGAAALASIALALLGLTHFLSVRAQQEGVRANEAKNILVGKLWDYQRAHGHFPESTEVLSFTNSAQEIQRSPELRRFQYRRTESGYTLRYDGVYGHHFTEECTASH